jgi:ABC-type oligopeptide transport system substrate-binding subunit
MGLVVVVAVVPGMATAQDRAFVLAIAFEPATLDPHQKLSTDSTQILRNIYDRLVDWKPGTAEIAPMIARSGTYLRTARSTRSRTSQGWLSRCLDSGVHFGTSDEW